MASAIDVVSLSRAKAWFSIGSMDAAQDNQLAAAITAASEWLDDKAGPVVQRTVDGVVVGRFADTAAAQNTRFEMAGLIFAAWLLRSQVLRVASVESFDVPAITGTAPPVDEIRALLGDEWVDVEPDAEQSPLIGSITLGVWSTP